jgi:hypothetical protein
VERSRPVMDIRSSSGKTQSYCKAVFCNQAIVCSLFQSPSYLSQRNFQSCKISYLHFPMVI